LPILCPRFGGVCHSARGLESLSFSCDFKAPVNQEVSLTRRQTRVLVQPTHTTSFTVWVEIHHCFHHREMCVVDYHDAALEPTIICCRLACPRCSPRANHHLTAIISALYAADSRAHDAAFEQAFRTTFACADNAYKSIIINTGIISNI